MSLLSWSTYEKLGIPLFKKIKKWMRLEFDNRKHKKMEMPCLRPKNFGNVLSSRPKKCLVQDQKNWERIQTIGAM